MDIVTEHSGLIHIGEKILKNLDFQTQLNCRLVKRSWKCILDKEASKTDLDSLLKELKQFMIDCDCVSVPSRPKKTIKDYKIWSDFLNVLSSKVNNYWIYYSIQNHIIRQDYNYTQHQSPLLFYALTKNVKMLEYVLKEEPKYKSDDIEFTIRKAVEYSYSEIATYLLSYIDNATMKGLIFRSARNGDCSMVELLVPNPKEPLIVDSLNNNLIHFAASRGHTEIVKYFLENTKGLMAQNSFGETPLYFALFSNNLSLMNMIVDAVSEDHILKPIKKGKNVIHIAAHGGIYEIVEKMCLKVSNPIMPDDAGNTPIHYAAWDGDLDMIKLLASYASDLKIPNKTGLTPLHIAKIKSHKNAARYLAEHERRQIENDLQFLSL